MPESSLLLAKNLQLVQTTELVIRGPFGVGLFDCARHGRLPGMPARRLIFEFCAVVFPADHRESRPIKAPAKLELRLEVCFADLDNRVGRHWHCLAGIHHRQSRPLGRRLRRDFFLVFIGSLELGPGSCILR